MCWMGCVVGGLLGSRGRGGCDAVMTGWEDGKEGAFGIGVAAPPHD